MEEREGNHLFSLMRRRRSKRFCKGMVIPDGPFKYASKHKPEPLSEEIEAKMAYAAAGITGGVFNELDYSEQGGGNIIAGKIGRTFASGDALQTVSTFVINDAGVSLLLRPREMEVKELFDLVSLSNDSSYLEIYRRQAQRVSHERPKVPTDPIHNININRWSSNAPGTTVFLPVNELSILYINGLLEIFNTKTGVYVLDERKNYLPAGLSQFAISNGGHLDDNPNNGKTVTVRHVESMVAEFAAIEQGMILQNLSLACTELGIAGYPAFANHEYTWFEALGFNMNSMKAGSYLGCPGWIRLALDLMKKNPQVPYPTGLSVNSQEILSSFKPDPDGTMRSAVMDVVNMKFGNTGVFGSTNELSKWRDEENVNKSVPKIQTEAIEATVAYCTYLWKNYGRFPAHFAPFRTVTCFQAGNADPDFYQEFMK